MSNEEARKCSCCGSANLKENVPVNKFGINYLSGLVVKTKPFKGSVCLDCGRVDFYLEDREDLADKELVQGTSSNFLPFILFALFILSLQLD